MTYDQFVATWTGKAADFDGVYGAQCVDLFNFYNRDVVGQDFVPTPTTGGAADLWNDYPSLPGYKKVANTPDGVPPKAAVVIWAANTKVTGAAGHVGMASGEGDATYFVSFDQNYPTGSLPHMQRHSYDGVLGWYIPNNQGGDEVITDADNEYWRWNKLFRQIRGRDASRDEFRQAAVGRTWLQALEILSDDQEADAASHAQEVGQVAVRDDWQGQISGLVTKVTDLTAQAQAQGRTIDALHSEAAKSDSTTAGLNKQIETLEAALRAAQATLPVQSPSSTTPSVPAIPAAPGEPKWANLAKQLRDFFGTTQGRAGLGIAATVVTPIVMALQNFHSDNAALAAAVLAAVTLLNTVKDALNPNVPNK
ncbi:CHAP domain [Arthrobacter sp. ok909]|uniref:CHAP domain-containing protein n=1 Tax=Arthrobacter sp. ok909 TaxID=1761746 RepID=UPI00088124D9|nr:CHAP domain-containing protein [Arthrobacter sp. ok909]SDP32897.1 CHAP domain [Arthrobacter sp. ok909]